MTTSPAISAIVPCFNVGGLLLRTVDSLRAQTVPPVEILVIDDASTTPETLAALTEAERIPTVRVLRQPVNSGVAAARNLGLEQAIGDFAVFLDGDDMFTAPSLATFLKALDGNPDASFAYPTVTCFGNRHDTFPAPEFNAYLLHHVNICPIASMVSRAAMDSGVRFDPGIVIGHEDWDYWLRLVAAGYTGVAAPDAVLLYRRVGFTRNDLGNQVEGGFEASLREIRPDVFNADRLIGLKREWAPGLSVITTDPMRAEQQVLGQTCRDAEILALPEAGDARGRVVAFEWDNDGSFLDDPFAIEDVLSMGSSLASDRILVSLAAHAVRPGTPSGTPEASDFPRGWVEASDIAAIALPNRWALDLIAGGEPIEPLIKSLLLEFGVVQAHRALWRAPQQPRTALDLAGRALAQPTAGRTRRHTPGWTRDVISGLRTGAPWRTTMAGGLFGGIGPSAFRDLIWVEDPFGGQSLYGTDEDQLMGSRSIRPGPSILRSAAAGAVPLNRVEDDHTHQRSVTSQEPSHGTTLQSVLGHVDSVPTPGSRLLGGEDFEIEGSRGTCWVPRNPRDGGQTWPRSSSVLFGSRVLWRGQRATGAGFLYGFSVKDLKKSHATVDGRLLIFMVNPPEKRPVNGLHFLLDHDGTPIGLTTTRDAPTGFRTSECIGYLDATQQPDQFALYAKEWKGTRSVACSRSVEELRILSSGPVELLGFSPPC
jgi:GT2 family glycosyltransferase